MCNGCFYRISIRSQTCGVEQEMKHDSNHRNEASNPGTSLQSNLDLSQLINFHYDN